MWPVFSSQSKFLIRVGWYHRRKPGSPTVNPVSLNAVCSKNTRENAKLTTSNPIAIIIAAIRVEKIRLDAMKYSILSFRFKVYVF